MSSRPGGSWPAYQSSLTLRLSSGAEGAVVPEEAVDAAVDLGGLKHLRSREKRLHSDTIFSICKFSLGSAIGLVSVAENGGKSMPTCCVRREYRVHPHLRFTNDDLRAGGFMGTAIVVKFFWQVGFTWIWSDLPGFSWTGPSLGCGLGSHGSLGKGNSKLANFKLQRKPMIGTAKLQYSKPRAARKTGWDAKPMIGGSR